MLLSFQHTQIIYRLDSNFYLNSKGGEHTAKKIICKKCGTVNIISEDATVGDGEDWLGCDLLSGFEWKLPAGKITPVVGDPIYISATGDQMSREEYLVKYNVDPEIAYQMMRVSTLREQMRLSRAVSKAVKPKEKSVLMGSVRKLMYK